MYKDQEVDYDWDNIFHDELTDSGVANFFPKQGRGRVKSGYMCLKFLQNF